MKLATTLALLLLAFAFVATPVRAEEYAASTTADPEIPVDWLELELKPKTKAQLEVETAAWRELLQAKVAEISAAQIAEKKGEAGIVEYWSAHNRSSLDGRPTGILD